MLNFKLFLNDFEHNLTKINARGKDYTPQLHYLRNLFLLKNQFLVVLNQLQAKINTASKNFQQVKTWSTTLAQIKQVVQLLKTTVKFSEQHFHQQLLHLPNVPADELLNTSHSENKIIFTSTHAKKISKLSHWQIGQQLSWLENVQAVQMSQSRFVTYCQGGARLLRALTNFMLDLHHKNGYSELVLPYLVKESALIGTGQFPKLKEDAFAIDQQNLFLIPTSEVSLVNFFANTLFDEQQLPQKVCSYSPCFRQEAGAAGSKTPGLLRLHQFHKVELVKICNQTTSFQELEQMVVDAKKILELLAIPYRLVQLAVTDLGVSASKTYDLEVWMPYQQKYVEIASLSNTTDFQSHYLQIKYRDQSKQKKLAHTLNGSGLAIDRLIACLLETYYHPQQQNFIYPEVLQKYLQR